MKRYSMIALDRSAHYQFPASDLFDAIEQAHRHAKARGLSVTDFKVKYTGKWHGEENPNTYTVPA